MEEDLAESVHHAVGAERESRVPLQVLGRRGKRVVQRQVAQLLPAQRVQRARRTVVHPHGVLPITDSYLVTLSLKASGIWYSNTGIWWYLKTTGNDGIFGGNRKVVTQRTMITESTIMTKTTVFLVIIRNKIIAENTGYLAIRLTLNISAKWL